LVFKISWTSRGLKGGALEAKARDEVASVPSCNPKKYSNNRIEIMMNQQVGWRKLTYRLQKKIKKGIHSYWI